MSDGISVILAAGGMGTRMGSKTPKAFLSLLGKPILIRSLEAFRGVTGICEIVLVLPPKHMDAAVRRYGDRIRRLGVSKIVSGGGTRRESVANALSLVDRKSHWILVHDAVRPFVTREEIREVVRAMKRTGAAILAVPARDTLKEADDRGRVVRTPDRSRFWHALTPQGFRADWLRKAHRRVRGEATDDALLVEKAGYPVQIVKGSPRNIKITTPEDLRTARALSRS